MKSVYPIGCPDPGHLFIRGILVQKMGAMEKRLEGLAALCRVLWLGFARLGGAFPDLSLLFFWIKKVAKKSLAQ